MLLDGDGRTVHVAMCWHRLERRQKGRRWYVWNVRSTYRKPGGLYVNNDDVEMQLHQVPPFAMGLSREHDEWGLVTEGLYGSALALAEAAGVVYGQMLHRTTGEHVRARWLAWAPWACGDEVRGRITSAKAKPILMRRARERFVGLGELVEVEHVVDAAWLAAWGVKHG